jgi:hypothetical protein
MLWVRKMDVVDRARALIVFLRFSSVGGNGRMILAPKVKKVAIDTHMGRKVANFRKTCL